MSLLLTIVVVALIALAALWGLAVFAYLLLGGIAGVFELIGMHRSLSRTAREIARGA